MSRRGIYVRLRPIATVCHVLGIFPVRGVLSDDGRLLRRTSPLSRRHCLPEPAILWDLFLISLLLTDIVLVLIFTGTFTQLDISEIAPSQRQVIPCAEKDKFNGRRNQSKQIALNESLPEKGTQRLFPYDVKILPCRQSRRPSKSESYSPETSRVNISLKFNDEFSVFYLRNSTKDFLSSVSKRFVSFRVYSKYVKQEDNIENLQNKKILPSRFRYFKKVVDATTNVSETLISRDRGPASESSRLENASSGNDSLFTQFEVHTATDNVGTKQSILISKFSFAMTCVGVLCQVLLFVVARAAAEKSVCLLALMEHLSDLLRRLEGKKISKYKRINIWKYPNRIRQMEFIVGAETLRERKRIIRRLCEHKKSDLWIENATLESDINFTLNNSRISRHLCDHSRMLLANLSKRMVFKSCIKFLQKNKVSKLKDFSHYRRKPVGNLTQIPIISNENKLRNLKFKVPVSIRSRNLFPIYSVAAYLAILVWIFLFYYRFFLVGDPPFPSKIPSQLVLSAHTVEQELKSIKSANVSPDTTSHQRQFQLQKTCFQDKADAENNLRRKKDFVHFEELKNNKKPNSFSSFYLYFCVIGTSLVTSYFFLHLMEAYFYMSETRDLFQRVDNLLLKQLRPFIGLEDVPSELQEYKGRTNRHWNLQPLHKRIEILRLVRATICSFVMGFERLDFKRDPKDMMKLIQPSTITGNFQKRENITDAEKSILTSSLNIIRTNHRHNFNQELTEDHNLNYGKTGNLSGLDSHQVRIGLERIQLDRDEETFHWQASCIEKETLNLGLIHKQRPLDDNIDCSTLKDLERIHKYRHAQDRNDTREKNTNEHIRESFRFISFLRDPILFKYPQVRYSPSKSKHGSRRNRWRQEFPRPISSFKYKNEKITSEKTSHFRDDFKEFFLPSCECGGGKSCGRLQGLNGSQGNVLLFLTIKFVSDLLLSSTLAISRGFITPWQVPLQILRLVGMTIIAVSASSLTEAGRGKIWIINSIRLNCLNQRSQNQVAALLAQLTGTPLEVTASGYFSLSKGFLVSSLSFVVTYVIIIIQLKLSEQ